MITLQVFNVCVALTSFVLATFVATRERQEEVARLYAAAKAANEAKSAFLNLAAHELRTPLTVLEGYLSMLDEASLARAPDSWTMPIHILKAKTAELDRIVDALLQASQVETNVAPVEGQVIDLRNVVEDAVARARPRADLMRADISTKLAREAVMVEADKTELGRVLDNLINNSLSYSVPPARLFIDMATDFQRAVVRVEDTGVGIPEDQREQVFDRFYRGASSTFVKVPGVGLGLYISRRLVERHGGSLSVESSTPGIGTVFAIALPLAKPV
jgi:signal transduction histidine kinase